MKIFLEKKLPLSQLILQLVYLKIFNMNEQKLSWKTEGNQQTLRYAYGEIIITKQKPNFDHGYLITTDPFSNEGNLNIHSSEENKIFDTLDQILTHMTSRRLNKSSKIFIKGGGMLLDIAGFAAQIYMRGITDVTYVPTTLLATVDAAVGGKTGLNYKTMKNFVGNTKNYTKILIYLPYLQTLDERQFFNGMGEVIKMASVYDSQFFQYLTTLTKKDLYLFKDEQLSETQKTQRKKTIQYHLTKIVKQCVMFKATVTLEDLTQKKARKWLNFGHTLSHAFQLSPYNTYKHGECVSIGMVKAAQLAYKYGYLKNKSDIQKLAQTAKNFGLPTQIPRYYNRKDMMQLMKTDKKKTTNENNTQFVLISQLGKRLQQAVKIPNDELYAFITEPIQIKYSKSLNLSSKRQISSDIQKKYCQIFQSLQSLTGKQAKMSLTINNLTELLLSLACNLGRAIDLTIQGLQAIKITNPKQYNIIIKNLFKIPGLQIGIYSNKLHLRNSLQPTNDYIIFQTGQNAQISMTFTIISALMNNQKRIKCIIDSKNKLYNDCLEFVQFITSKGVSFNPIEYVETQFHVSNKSYDKKTKFLITDSETKQNLQEAKIISKHLNLNVAQLSISSNIQQLNTFSQFVHKKGSNNLILINKNLTINPDIQRIIQNNYSFYLQEFKKDQQKPVTFANKVLKKWHSNKTQYYQNQLNMLKNFTPIQGQQNFQSQGLILMEDNFENYTNSNQYQFCKKFSAIQILADKIISSYLNQGLSINNSVDKFRNDFSKFKMHIGKTPVILSLASIQQPLQQHQKFEKIIKQLAKTPSNWFAMPISHRIDFEYDFNKIIWTYKGSQQGMIQLLSSRPYGLKRWYMTPFSASSRNNFQIMRKNIDISIFLGDYLSQMNNRYQMVGRHPNKSTGIPDLTLIQTLRKLSKMIK